MRDKKEKARPKLSTPELVSQKFSSTISLSLQISAIPEVNTSTSDDFVVFSGTLV